MVDFDLDVAADNEAPTITGLQGGPPVIWAKPYNDIPAVSSSSEFPTSHPNHLAQFQKLWGTWARTRFGTIEHLAQAEAVRWRPSAATVTPSPP